MARFVFSGLFDRHPGLKIITHHLGGMIPYYEARIEHGYAGWAYASEIDNPLTCYDNPWTFAAMTPDVSSNLDRKPAGPRGSAS